MFLDLLEKVLEVSNSSNLPDLQRRFIDIWKKKELGDGLDSPDRIKGEFWLLSNGRILDSYRHKDAPEMLKVDWDTWLKTGAMRGLIEGYALPKTLYLEKHDDSIVSLDQVKTIFDIIVKQNLNTLYFEVVSEEDTVTHRSEEIDLSDYMGNRKLLAILKKILK